MKHLEKLSLELLEKSEGWKYFLRFPSALSANLNFSLSTDIVRRFPRAVLGLNFAKAKSGDVFGARSDYDSWRSELTELAKCDALLSADLTLVDIHLSIYEDRTFNRESLERLINARRQLLEEDHIGHALVFNYKCNIAMQMGDFELAQKNAEKAIQLYQQGDAVFGALHMHTYLGQIRLMRGDLQGAGKVLQTMEAQLGELPGQAPWLIAVARILRAEVAYESNDLGQAALLCAAAFNMVEQGDAWFDILTAAFRVHARLAYAELGLPGALESLSHADQVALDRGMPRLFRLMQIERLRALTLSGETKTAARLLSEIGLSTDRSQLEQSDDLAFRQGATFVAVARLMVRTRRARDALDFIATAEDLAIRRGQLLALAKLRVIAAAAFWNLRSRVEATSSLLSAIRLLGDQPFLRFILDEGPEMRFIVQAALDGTHVSVPPTPAQRRRLSELMHYWATSGRTSVRRDRADSADLHKRYLELLDLGHSNKDIAQIMGVSDNTVKYHLKQIFRKLDANSRSRAVRNARDRGVLDR